MADKKQIRYCAFCRNPHRIYLKKGSGPLHWFLSLILSLAFMYAIWESLNLQALPVFILSLFFGELVAHFRWRLALICRQCGFDPLIYKKDPSQAAKKVKAFLTRRKLDPAFILAPPLKIPRRSEVHDWADRREKLLS